MPCPVSVSEVVSSEVVGDCGGGSRGVTSASMEDCDATPPNALCVTLCKWPWSSGLLAALSSSALMIFSVFSRAACSTIRWLRTLSLARAAASSSVASACRARSCHAIARSVRHCKASPSGSRTGNFCSDTNKDRMVSRRGRRDRRHKGHRNLRLRVAWTTAEGELLFFSWADFGSGTQLPVNQQVSIDCSSVQWVHFDWDINGLMQLTHWSCVFLALTHQ